MLPSKNILKIVTAGHVDDGKSTLIGRLLYETNSLKDDQLEHIQNKSKSMGYDYLDLSLATDGLLTEREQGITIDVSHIYFTDQDRRYVIADSPGHEEYTRNMVTGASSADCALLLVDVRNGITKQTVRHLTILSMLNIAHVAVIINKVDLVEYDMETIQALQKEFDSLLSNYDNPPSCTFIPISALKGDNITRLSENTPWYTGSTLFQFLNNVPVEDYQTAEAILQVQTVIRPKTLAHADYRGYAGKIRSGFFKTGDSVTLFPSGRSTRIRQLEKYNQHIDSAHEGENVTVLLEDEHDLSRGDSIFIPQEGFEVSNEVELTTCWMDKHSLAVGNVYTLQHGIDESRAKVVAINHEYDLADHSKAPATALEMNAIGSVTCVLSKPLLVSEFRHNRRNGAVLFINEQTHSTAGVGFVSH